MCSFTFFPSFQTLLWRCPWTAPGITGETSPHCPPHLPSPHRKTDVRPRKRYGPESWLGKRVWCGGACVCSCCERAIRLPFHLMQLEWEEDEDKFELNIGVTNPEKVGKLLFVKCICFNCFGADASRFMMIRFTIFQLGAMHIWYSSAFELWSVPRPAIYCMMLSTDAQQWQCPSSQTQCLCSDHEHNHLTQRLTYHTMLSVVFNQIPFC